MVLQINLCKTFIAGAAQSVATNQFADSAFNSVSLLHLALKFGALLLVASLLQCFVQGSYHDRAMRLIFGDA